MSDNTRTIAQRLKDLEGAAQKARLEAMRLAATLLTKESALLAGPPANADPSTDLDQAERHSETIQRGRTAASAGHRGTFTQKGS